MKRKTNNEITTLTPADAVGCAEVDLPIGRLVRIEGDDALFVVEAGEGCAGCALDGDVYEDPPFPCDAFACCESDRRDEMNVVLRRVDDSDAAPSTEPEATAMRERRRQGPFIDLGDLRRALAVYAVDRPVKIRLPDGSEFAVGAVRRDRDFEPLEDAPVLLIAANVDKQEKKNDET